VLVSNRQIVVCKQEAEPRVLTAIEQRVRAFWHSIETLSPPAFDLDKDLELMARTLTNIETGLELNWRGNERANLLISHYGELSDTERTARDGKDRIRGCEAGQVSAKVTGGENAARKSLRITPRNV
jgi:hypothetical protein